MCILPPGANLCTLRFSLEVRGVVGVLSPAQWLDNGQRTMRACRYLGQDRGMLFRSAPWEFRHFLRVQRFERPHTIENTTS